MKKIQPNNRSRTRYLAVYLKNTEFPSLADLERDYVNYVLEITNNDPVATAEILDVPPAHLFRRMKKIEVWI